MQKTVTKSLSFVLVLLMLFSSVSAGSYASAVGKVATLKATGSSTSKIALSWTKVSDAKGYRVYRYNTSTKKWQAIKNTTATTFIDSKLSAGTLYSYGVRAVATENGKEALGEASNIIKVLTKPGDLKNLKVSKTSSTAVSLSWSKSAGAQGYAVYQYNTSTKKYDRIGVPSTNSFTVQNLSPSKSYRFAVRAYVKNGSVVYGKEAYVDAKTKALSVSKVTNFRLESVNDKGFRLAWDAVSGATGYQLGVYNAATKKWSSVLVTSKTYADFTAKDVNENYTYTVRAYVKTAGGNVFGPLATSVSAFAKPGVPKNLKGAENSDYGISLAWSKVSGAAGYEIQIYDAASGKWVNEATVTTNSCNIKDVTKTSQYKFRVRAYKVSSGKKFYGDYCESITVVYEGAESDSIYSEEMEKSGVFGYLYDPSEKCFYTAADPWQRNAGYNSAYDTAAPLALINFDTVRLRFEYGSKDWMIQVWKGQYGLVFYGAEVGVYTKPKNRLIMHYDCASDSEMLKMSMVYNELRLGKMTEKFTRPYGYYWWCTGFLPGNKLGNFDSIRLDLRITAKDYTMLDGIKKALSSNNITYTAKGLDVYFSF